MIIISLLAVGLLVGILSTFFGIGGGMIAIPALYFLFPEIGPHTVLGTSLLMTFFVASNNSLNHFKAGKAILWRPLLWTTLGIIVFSLIAGRVLYFIPGELLKKLLGIYLLYAAIELIIKKNPKKESEHSGLRFLPFKAVFTGALVGILSVFTGVGGGGILVPMFISLLKMPLSLVSFHSNLAMILTALVGVMSYLFPPASEQIPITTFYPQFTFGHVNLAMAILLFTGSFATSKWGVSLEKRCSEKIKKGLFVVFLLALATKILLFS